MGYDISLHPISPKEINDWYFTPLSWIREGHEEKVLQLAKSHRMEDFYAKKYLDTLRVGAETEEDELFDKSHGFYIAVIQGFFRPYYYTRGSSFSFLIEQKPQYSKYLSSWDNIIPYKIPNPKENRIIENYCSGAYLSPEQVLNLLKALKEDSQVRKDLEEVWVSGQMDVLLKALETASKLDCGLLEATEVVEPDPINPNKSTSYSNLFNCDKDGIYIYMDAVVKQIQDAMSRK